MKNLPLILSIIALAASGFLFVNDFSGEKGTQVDAQSAGKIAFVNMDSLQQQYDFYIDLKAEFSAKEKNAERDLQKRIQNYAVKEEKFVKQYKAGLLSANEAQKKQQDLQAEAAKLQEYKRSVEEGLISITQEKNEELFNKVTDFLKEYNKEKGYSYIFRHGIGSPLLITDEAHNITDAVIKGLNEAYKSEKSNSEEVKDEE